jgi:hypothetical protein
VKKLVLGLLVTALAGCATTAKIDAGQHTVGSRLVFNLDGAWNLVNVPGQRAAEIWTMEGLPIDQLLVYSGVKNDEDISLNSALAQAEPQKRPSKFRSSMQADQIVALFEAMYTRDGSIFTLTKLAPAIFAGRKGFRFEYSITRKLDSALLSGIAYGAVDAGELFAIVYVAPRLTFFPRHLATIERMASSARLAAVGGDSPGRRTAIEDVNAVPYLSERGKQGYVEWLTKPLPRAFVVSANGTFFSTWGTPPKSTEPADAAERALSRCNARRLAKCSLYAVDHQVVWKPE